MTEEEMAVELDKAKEEHRRLTKQLRSLKLRAKRYSTTLSNISICMENLLDDEDDRELGNTSISIREENWPTLEDITNICHEVYKIEEDIKKIEKLLKF